MNDIWAILILCCIIAIQFRIGYFFAHTNDRAVDLFSEAEKSEESFTQTIKDMLPSQTDKYKQFHIDNNKKLDQLQIDMQATIQELNNMDADLTEGSPTENKKRKKRAA